MDEHRPWLGQADVFSNAPILQVTLAEERLTSEILYGPALLLTHDCAMDKATADGLPKTDWLQFARIRLASQLPDQRRGNVWRARDDVPPYDVMWLGEVGAFGDCYMVLSDPYHVPVEYFDTRCIQYDEQVDDRPNLPRATPRRNDSRMGRLPPDRVFLLQQKMLIYWTRFNPPTAPAG